MEKSFVVRFRHSAGNLHIDLAGVFTGKCAWELIKTIRRRHTGMGRIFVNTEKLNCLHADGVVLFKQHMSACPIPINTLFIKGKNGFALGPDGSRVLIAKKQTGRGTMDLPKNKLRVFQGLLKNHRNA
ncbi:MAG: hypothetical protein ABIK15_16780 [Pseudomonadota bacterium]